MYPWEGLRPCRTNVERQSCSFKEDLEEQEQVSSNGDVQSDNAFFQQRSSTFHQKCFIFVSTLPVPLPNTLLEEDTIKLIIGFLCELFPPLATKRANKTWLTSVFSTYLNLHGDWIPRLITSDSATTGEVDKSNYHQAPKAEAWLGTSASKCARVDMSVKADWNLLANQISAEKPDYSVLWNPKLRNWADTRHRRFDGLDMQETRTW